MKVDAKILVVDDEPEICLVLCKILAKEGYQAEQACNGLIALQKWRNKASSPEAYDLLIVDLKMPKMDGITLLGEIRKTDALLPLIVLTGHADLDDAYKLLTDHQIADFHNKPLKNRHSLLFSVRNALEKAHLQKDLTKLNDQYLQLNTLLGQRVIKRTEQLHVQMCRAQKANEAKSAFLGRMSHELRTPLNAILGLTQIQAFQLDSKNYDQVKESLPLVLEAGRHLLRLVDDTLDIESLEKGKITIAVNHCDLDSIFAECFAVVQAQVEEANLTLDCSNSSLAVLADASRLKQIVVNLLSNAIKFNRAGGKVTVVVNASSYIAGNAMVNICVKDTGVGIIEADLPLIFEPFTRLKYADDAAIDGVGNGLAICKLLAVQMHGDIKVKSEIGLGSEFILQLPLSKS
ncbi:MAG: hybrid sensor histidine kinase/response regulator [Algicola sp.]|nr:hybrid sensor histidine kinase/response regulator [Algicola sp.]